MSKIQTRNLSAVAHRRLRLASAYLGMAQQEFLTLAIDEAIRLRQIPQAVFEQPQATPNFVGADIAHSADYTAKLTIDLDPTQLRGY